MMKNILITIATLIFCSCSFSSEDPEVQKAYDEVMIIHDEVMPEMSTIHRLKKQIRKLESLDSLDLALIKELEDADEAMMSWMAAFKPNKDGSKEEQLKYLNAEKDNIASVSEQMKSVIEKAKTHVEK